MFITQGKTKSLDFYSVGQQPSKLVVVDSPGCESLGRFTFFFHLNFLLSYGRRGRPEWGKLWDLYIESREEYVLILTHPRPSTLHPLFGLSLFCSSQTSARVHPNKWATWCHKNGQPNIRNPPIRLGRSKSSGNAVHSPSSADQMRPNAQVSGHRSHTQNRTGHSRTCTGLFACTTYTNFGAHSRNRSGEFEGFDG